MHKPVHINTAALSSFLLHAALTLCLMGHTACVSKRSLSSETFAAREKYISALQALTVARSHELISDNAARSIEVTRAEAANALALMEHAASTNDHTKFDNAIRRFDHAYNMLLSQSASKSKEIRQ